MWSRGLLLKRPMPSFFTWGQSVLTQSLLRSNGQKSCFESSQAKVNWILLLIVNYSSKNLTESWQKLRHPAAGIFPSSTCAQPAGGLAATLQQECKEQEKVKSQWHLFMLMKHKSIFFFYFLNTVWPCAFNVWYPHFDKQHEVFLSHVFLSVPLLPPSLSPSLSLLSHSLPSPNLNAIKYVFEEKFCRIISERFFLFHSEDELVKFHSPRRQWVATTACKFKL